MESKSLKQFTDMNTDTALGGRLVKPVEPPTDPQPVAGAPLSPDE